MWAFYLIIAVEYFIKRFSGDANTGIADLNDGEGCRFAVGRGSRFHAEVQPHCSTRRREFQGIGKQVIDDQFCFISVKNKRRHGAIQFQGKLDATLFCQGQKRTEDLPDMPGKIAVPEVQMHGAAFEFGQLQQLIHHVQQPKTIALNMPCIFYDIGVFRLGQNAAGGFQHQGERRSEFVGDIAKKVGFHLFERFDAFGFTLFIGQLLAYFHAVDL